MRHFTVIKQPSESKNSLGWWPGISDWQSMNKGKNFIFETETRRRIRLNIKTETRLVWPFLVTFETETRVWSYPGF